MAENLSRRQFLARSVATTVGLGLVIGGAEAGSKGLKLLEQHETWAEAAKPNQRFLAAHAAALQRLSLGASFAPEQWPLDDASQQEALAGLDLVTRDLGLAKLRLGLRWGRVGDGPGIDLSAYQPFLDHCFATGSEVCLNVGPIRTFRWPEEHLPQTLLDRLPGLPARGYVVGLEQPLAQAGLDYVERLLDTLVSDYGRPAQLSAVQIENEPFYPLGEHGWRISQDYAASLAGRVQAVLPDVDLLVTSAGRLNLLAVRDLFVRLLAEQPAFAGRLVSGFDFHYKTPKRHSYPLVRYFDQISFARPFTASCEDNIHNARDTGFRIEVTEGQAEPYGHFQSPGNSARDFRYMLLRCLDKVLDPRQPALIRIWGIEELAKKMLRGELTDEHRQIIELVQAINGPPPAVERRA